MCARGFISFAFVDQNQCIIEYMNSKDDNVLSAQHEVKKDDNFFGTFEQAFEQLNQLIKAFQQGNLKLKEAIEKYEFCKQLIDYCNLKLAELEKPILEKIEHQQLDFEKNINTLEALQHQLNSQTSLSQLAQIQTQSAILFQQCQLILEDFQNKIEYVK